VVEFLLVKFDLSKDIFWVDITSIFAELLLCPAWLSTFFSNWAWCQNHEKSDILFAYDAANIPTWNVKRWLLCNLGNYFQILYSAERWEPKINCTVFLTERISSFSRNVWMLQQLANIIHTACLRATKPPYGTTSPHFARPPCALILLFSIWTGQPFQTDRFYFGI